MRGSKFNNSRTNISDLFKNLIREINTIILLKVVS